MFETRASLSQTKWGRGRQDVPLLIEELLTIDFCWERESLFSLKL